MARSYGCDECPLHESKAENEHYLAWLLDREYAVKFGLPFERSGLMQADLRILQRVDCVRNEMAQKKARQGASGRG